MNSFVKGVSIGTATGLAAMTAYLATQAARRSIDRSLERVEQVAGQAQEALDSTRDTLAHTQRAVRGIRDAVGPSR
jgi:hypothetical protein